eukprot:SAG22_NODE_1096_length_5579_cov_5.298175_5_plen_122_part_00
MHCILSVGRPHHDIITHHCAGRCIGLNSWGTTLVFRHQPAATAAADEEGGGGGDGGREGERYGKIDRLVPLPGGTVQELKSKRKQLPAGWAAFALRLASNDTGCAVGTLKFCCAGIVEPQG